MSASTINNLRLAITEAIHRLLPAISESIHRLLPAIIEAMHRLLPAQFLGHFFKSVSKTGKSLRFDPQNIDHRRTRRLLFGSGTSLYSVDINELLPYLRSDEIPATVKKLSFYSPRVEILGSCNGLVLARDENDSIFLLNPTTKELWKVPHCPFKLSDEFFVRYGFGYDSSTDDYKVVSISFWSPESRLKPECNVTFVSIYSLRNNNSWRKLPNSPYNHTIHYAISGALINQKYHWLVSSSMIVAFSFANEVFDEIKLPKLFKDQKAGFIDVVDIGGKLGVCVGIWGVYELWVMNEYGVCNSWARVFSHEFSNPVRPVCLIEGSNGDIVFEDLGFIFVYNIDEKRCRNLRMVGGPYRFPVGLGGTYYVETLESPKRIMTAP